jgi:FkbM family methyltransferase
MEKRKEIVKYLMSDARKKTGQDPEKILSSLNISEGMTLADLGCGPGFFTIPMAQKVGEKGRVYAVDSNQSMLDHLQENIVNANINQNSIIMINSDVSSTKIPENSVDVAFFANVLHEVNDKQAFFQELKRICKPMAIVVDIDWKKAQTERGPPVNVRLSEAEAEKVLSENGFPIVKQIDLGPSHYELVCKLASR